MAMPVMIHNKAYKTVAERVNEFRSGDYQGYSLTTEIVHLDADTVVTKATMATEDGRVIATGFAEENRASSQINRTSALENCETSAIGRCLANFGLGGTEYASANEVENAIHQQSTPKKRINKELVQKYVQGFVEAIEAEDGLAMREMGDELKDTPEHDAVWQALNSKQKAAVKAAIHSLGT